jgi:hypothetical protein
MNGSIEDPQIRHLSTRKANISKMHPLEEKPTVNAGTQQEFACLNIEMVSPMPRLKSPENRKP